MPIVMTFDLSRPTSLELARLRSAFERLGWERVGNTAYRYPPLGEQPETEDWFNRVVPALMLLRAYSRSAAASGRGIVRFSLDAQSSTGYNDGEEPVGTLPLSADEIEMIDPPIAASSFGEQQLRDWIDGIEWPYAPEEQDDVGQ